MSTAYGTASDKNHYAILGDKSNSVIDYEHKQEYATMSKQSERGISFPMPDTEQGRRVAEGLSALFADRLAGTPAAPLFTRMDDRQLAYHVDQLGGALIAAAQDELAPEALEWLTRRHQKVPISAAQFDFTAGAVLGVLAEVDKRRGPDEPVMVEKITALAPTLRTAFVTE